MNSLMSLHRFKHFAMQLTDAVCKMTAATVAGNGCNKGKPQGERKWDEADKF
jgi:hypothetical protein